MSEFSVSCTKTKREFAGNRYTTIARFKIKPLDGGKALFYEGNATGIEFIDKCDRLKRQATTIGDPGLVSMCAQDDWKEELVRRALAETPGSDAIDG